MTTRSPSLPRRLRTLATSSAGGALVAQVWQAAATFTLQLVAAHALGADGLGVLALCLGVVILGTAVTSGFVGDSLTVLDRHDRRVRSALQGWTLGLALVGPVVAATVLAGTGVLGRGEAVAFAAAASLFQVEEVARRLLMATLRFWRLVLVDAAALVVSLGFVALVALGGPVTLTTFFVGMLLGQAAGVAVAVSQLPAEERRVVPLGRGGWREVARYGSWRGAQVAVNPATLTVVRVLVVGAVGTAALGSLEAARMYVAPALLTVQGLGSYFFSSYARDRVLPLADLRARARRGSLAAVGLVAASGLVLVAASPLAGPLVTGSSFDLALLAVGGWLAYAAGIATMQPFASLAAARGGQRAVLGVRLLDGGTSAGLVALALALGVPTAVLPFLLAVGPLTGGLVVRRVVLTRLAAAESAHPSSTDRRSPAPAAAREAVHHAR